MHAADDRKLKALLDLEFDGRPGLIEEFPLLVGRGRQGGGFVYEHSNQYVAHTAWRPFELVSGAERIPAVGIGLVTTHSSWRGRGLATALVRRCMEEARDRSAELAILFAPPRSLYSRLGFVPAGRERATRADAVGTGGHKQIRAAEPGDVAAMLRLLELHPVRVSRTLAEFEALLEIPGTHATLFERDACPVAYCVEGKGRDLRGIVHEWAGEREAVARLIHGLASSRADPLWVLSPESQPAPVEGETLLQTMAQICILRGERFGSDDPLQVFGAPETPARTPLYIWGLDSV